MNDFYIGQKVVCIDDSPVRNADDRPHWFGLDTLKRGAIYTISDIEPDASSIFQDSSSIGLRLQEVKVYWFGKEWWLGTSRFRPLETKAIEIFRQIARDVTADAKRKQPVEQ